MMPPTTWFGEYIPEVVSISTQFYLICYWKVLALNLSLWYLMWLALLTIFCLISSYYCCPVSSLIPAVTGYCDFNISYIWDFSVWVQHKRASCPWSCHLMLLLKMIELHYLHYYFLILCNCNVKTHHRNKLVDITWYPKYRRNYWKEFHAEILNACYSDYGIVTMLIIKWLMFHWLHDNLIAKYIKWNKILT